MISDQFAFAALWVYLAISLITFIVVVIKYSIFELRYIKYLSCTHEKFITMILVSLCWFLVIPYLLFVALAQLIMYLTEKIYNAKNL